MQTVSLQEELLVTVVSKNNIKQNVHVHVHVHSTLKGCLVNSFCKAFLVPTGSDSP